MPYYVRRKDIDFETDLVLWWVYDQKTGEKLGAWCRAKD